MPNDENQGGSSSDVHTIGEVAGGVGTGLDNAAKSLPAGEVQEVVETAGDVAQAVSQLVRTAEAAAKLGEALEAGDEARAAGAIGDLAGGVLGTAGAGMDAIVGAVPAEARGALSTVADAARGAATAARTAGQAVRTAVPIIERALGGGGRRVVFHTGADLGGDRLRVRSAELRRSLSGLYEVTIHLTHNEEGGLDDDAIEALLTHAARVGLSDGDSAGDVHGIVRRLEMRAMTGPRPTHYVLTLAPRMWRLSLVTRSRVYQDKTHLEVVIEVLRQHGLDVGTHVLDRTEGTYPTHEYVVQHEETDLAFVERLLAHNGIHFHLMQDAGTEVIVLGDRNAAFEPIPEHDELVYHPHDFPADDGEPRVWDLRRVREPRVEAVVLRDYNWRAPHAPLRVEEPADLETGYGFLDVYGAHFRDDAEGARLARIRAEAEVATREVFIGKTSLRGVAPGAWFELTNHPNQALNQRYLVIATEESADSGNAYECEFRAIPFSVTYRPPRTVPWPRVEGLVTAIIDGERRSTATPIDDDGRYRVVIPMDEAATAGGRASRWVRRAQPSVGAGYGMHFPLHIGSEVALAYVNGDPDRPVIVGAVPNGATQSPVVGSNATQSRIRSGSGVVIELDDDC